LIIGAHDQILSCDIQPISWRHTKHKVEISSWSLCCISTQGITFSCVVQMVKLKIKTSVSPENVATYLLSRELSGSKLVRKYSLKQTGREDR